MTLYGVTALDSGTAQTVRFLIEAKDQTRAVEAVTDHTGLSPIMWQPVTPQEMEKWRNTKNG